MRVSGFISEANCFKALCDLYEITHDRIRPIKIGSHARKFGISNSFYSACLKLGVISYLSRGDDGSRYKWGWAEKPSVPLVKTIRNKAYELTYHKQRPDKRGCNGAPNKSAKESGIFTVKYSTPVENDIKKLDTDSLIAELKRRNWTGRLELKKVIEL